MFPNRHAALIVMSALFISTGCSTAMTHSNPNRSSSGAQTTKATLWEWPLKFKAHNFSAFTYSTYGAKVKYGNRTYINAPEDKLQISSESLGDKYPDNLGASHLAIRNFPPPAQVSWRAKDGTPLQAQVDMAEIFKDGLIRHKLKREEISEAGSIPSPDIILEVNDRTINVYMRAFITTKELQRPSSRHSNFRNDLIKVYSRTY